MNLADLTRWGSETGYGNKSLADLMVKLNVILQMRLWKITRNRKVYRKHKSRLYSPLCYPEPDLKAKIIVKNIQIFLNC